MNISQASSMNMHIHFLREMFISLFHLTCHDHFKGDTKDSLLDIRQSIYKTCKFRPKQKSNMVGNIARKLLTVMINNFVNTSL